MQPTQENITDAILSAIDLAQQGRIKACKEQLQTVYSCIKSTPFLLWNTNFVAPMGKAVVLMIHLDLIDDETENIDLAHWSYLYLSKGINDMLQHPEPNSEQTFNYYKDRVILLKSFDDFFVDSLRAFYFSDKLSSNRNDYLEQRKAVLSRVPLLILADIYHIEQQHTNLNNDEYLLEVANYLEQDIDFTSENLNEAILLHKVLYQQTLKAFQK